MELTTEKKKEIDEKFNKFLEDSIIKYGLKKSSGRIINPILVTRRISIAELIISDMAEIQIIGGDVEGDIFDHISEAKSKIVHSVINEYDSE